MEQNFFDIDPRLEKLGEQAQLDCAQAFARTEEIGEYNSRKVLAAFLHNGVSESHFAGSTGYGYDDRGRETLEAVMAEITGSEDALMRHNFVSGTHTLTTALFGVLRPGDVIAYYGDLGAGKTAFTRGLAAGLGIREAVTSPTYTIVNEYLSGRMPLFHFDMYRLSSSEELFDIGWEDYLARGGVCAVEWSENVADALTDAISITIEKDPAQLDWRKITIEGGARFEALGL